MTLPGGARLLSLRSSRWWWCPLTLVFFLLRRVVVVSGNVGLLWFLVEEEEEKNGRVDRSRPFCAVVVGVWVAPHDFGFPSRVFIAL